MVAGVLMGGVCDCCWMIAGDGYTTVVGRVRDSDPVFDAKFVVVSHNTVMGAAGSSILNAELAAQRGLIGRRATGAK